MTSYTPIFLKWHMAALAMLGIEITVMACRRGGLMTANACIFRMTRLACVAIQIRSDTVSAFTPEIRMITGRFNLMALRTALLRMAE